MRSAAFVQGIRPAWVSADEVYGSDGKFWWWLEQEYHQAYVLTVSSQHSVTLGWQQHRARELAKTLPAEAWQRLSCGDGSLMRAPI